MSVIASTFGGAFIIPWRVAASSGDVPHLVFVLLTASAIFSSAGSLLPAMRLGRRALNRTAVAVAVVFAITSLLGNHASASSAALLSAPLVAVLLRSQVLWVAILAWIFMAERVNATYWLGVAVAAVGMIILHDPWSGAAGGVDVRGTLFAIGASLCFGSMVVLTRRFHTFIEPLPVNALRMWLAVGAWLAAYGPPSPELLTPRLVGLGSLAAFLGPTCSRSLGLYAVRHMPARMVALIALLSPLQTLVFAWLILDEVPSPVELWGGGIMLAGIAVPVVRSLRP